MKKCSYCGRESLDDADYCPGCGSPFAAAPIARERPSRISKQAKEGECSYCGLENAAQAEYCSGCGSRFVRAPAATADQGPANLTSSETIDSDNFWSAKDAWKCLGMFVLFEFIIAGVWRAIGIAFPGSRYFFGTGAGRFVFSIVHYSVQILNVLYFARTESWQSFEKAFGLTKNVTRYTWFAVAVALIIRSVGHLVITSGLSRGVTTTSLWGFAHSIGFQRILYLMPALMAPFAEELYMRGFFYRAFRGSYSVMVSTLLILGITAMTHFNQVQRSWIAAVDIGAITILQCFLRERTGNLWDCILCHLVFNATGALLSLRVH
jgi:membrane protease YdiL (CAAX protease family)